MNKSGLAVLTVVIVAHCASLAFADYTFVLKNGRRITAKSYREDGSMLKVQGLGGEFGIPKDQIQTILNAAQSERSGLNITDLETSPRQAPIPQKPPFSTTPEAKGAADPSETKSMADAEEEKDYQKRLAEITQKLEAAKEEYFKATQGGGTSSNVSTAGMKAWTMDFASRIHDSQKVLGGGGPSDTPPAPPYAPVYTAKERELSELRSQIDGLQKQRDALVQEMKSKNMPTSGF